MSKHNDILEIKIKLLYKIYWYSKLSSLRWRGDWLSSWLVTGVETQSRQCSDLFEPIALNPGPDNQWQTDSSKFGFCSICWDLTWMMMDDEQWSLAGRLAGTDRAENLWEIGNWTGLDYLDIYVKNTQKLFSCFWNIKQTKF